MNQSKKNIVIVGAGRVGSSLGYALFKCGYRISAVINKPYNLALKLGTKVATEIVSDNLNNIPDIEKIIFLCVEDEKIGQVAEILSTMDNVTEKDIVVHTSGIINISSLKSLEIKGCKIGCFHPMQTFPEVTYSSKYFKNIYIGLEGSENIIQILKQIVCDLNCHPVVIKTNEKIPYHLGGVFASNYLVCLLYVVKKLYEKIGISEQTAIEILKPIISRTLSNIQKKGTVDSLTGPIVRGDIVSVKKHLNYIEKNFSEIEDLYIELSRVCIQIIKEKGDVNPDYVYQIEKVINR